MPHPPIRKLVIPAAGLGTRLLPATKAQPKEMLPLIDKPVIQYVVEEAVASGITQVIIVTGRGKIAIADHFDVSFELERHLERKGDTSLLRSLRAISELAQIVYVRQGEPRGLGDAVLTARDVVGDEPFAVVLPDDVIDADPPALAQLIAVYEHHGSSVLAIREVDAPSVERFGVVAGDALEGEPRTLLVRDLVEKPAQAAAPSRSAIFGRYVLTPEIFGLLADTPRGAAGEVQLTDGLRALLRSQRVLAHAFTGDLYDCGTKLGLLQTSIALGLRRSDLGPALRKYLEALLERQPAAP